MTAEGQSVVARAEPVPAAPPTTGDVIRHGAQVGLGALGLARSAVGSILGRSPASRPRVPTPPSTADLVPGAIAGLAILAERRVLALAGNVVSGVATVAGVVTRPAVLQPALRPLEDRIWEWNELARREQTRNRGEAARAIPVIIQQVTENLVAQLDVAAIVGRIPLEDVVEQMDVEAIVARIDLARVIRESTAGLTSETVDALREQGMVLDAFTARVVDRLLFRKRPRRLDMGAAAS